MFYVPIPKRESVPVKRLTEVFDEYRGVYTDTETTGHSEAIQQMLNAIQLSERVFSQIPDKNDPARTLYAHQLSVARRMVLAFGDILTDDQDRLATNVGVAILHDLFELDRRGQSQWNEGRLKDLGFTPAFARKIAIMRHDKNVPYLDYIQNICKTDIDCAMTKYVDLEDNQSPYRGARQNFTQQQMDKQAVIYPASQVYVWAVLSGEINPHEINVPQFIMQNPFVDARLKKQDILASYSSDKTDYEGRRAPAVMSIIRNVGSVFMPKALALTSLTPCS